MDGHARKKLLLVQEIVAHLVSNVVAFLNGKILTHRNV